MARSDSSKNSASDSSKKVAKAAKAGSTPSSAVGREQRSLGFPMAMAAVIVLGTALVAFAWNARDVEALSPSFDDHWHLPIGIYDCTTDGFLPNFEDPGLANAGIHTHGDGVIHLHPFSSSATGNNAQLERFLDATRTDIVNDERMTFADRPALEEGVQCGGEDAILQIARFAPGASTPSEVVTEDLRNFRFRQDQEGIVIALAPAGADIPPPPEASVSQAAAASPNSLRTDGLGDLDAGITGEGFDADGNLLDGDGNVFLDEDGNPININDVLANNDADAAADADADADADTEADG